jgi:hypothetical protein
MTIQHNGKVLAIFFGEPEDIPDTVYIRALKDDANNAPMPAGTIVPAVRIGRNQVNDGVRFQTVGDSWETDGWWFSYPADTVEHEDDYDVLVEV